MDVTSKTEGKAFADATGVPLLVKYDTRLRDNVAKNIVQDVTTQVQVRLLGARPAGSRRLLHVCGVCESVLHVCHLTGLWRLTLCGGMSGSQYARALHCWVAPLQ